MDDISQPLDRPGESASIWRRVEGASLSNINDESSLHEFLFLQVTLSSKLRPVEWSTWVRGGRKSQERPIIGDPQEFGEAVTRWWGMLKGDVGQEGALSTRLTKSGPNGISSLVLLLFWWGQAAIAGPGEWLGDSMPAWRSTVQEVTDTFASLLVAMTGPSGLSPAVERMTEGATTRASKRGRLADESVDTANKRNRR